MQPRALARAMMIIAAGTAVYVSAAYLLLPSLWKHHEHQPALASQSMVTTTAQGIPADPINVGLVGSQTEVIEAMHTAGWSPADPVTLASSFEIGESVVLDRAYQDAPISSLFYNNQRQSLAFEKAEGVSAKRRHHVRLWPSLQAGVEGRPVWLGAASFDRGVGVSHYTGQVTHHIGPDLDAERGLLMADLTRAGVVQSIYQISGIGPTLRAHNGGGDLYFTDGEVTVGVLGGNGAPQNPSPPTLDNPPAIKAKAFMWTALERLGHDLKLVPRNYDSDEF